MNYCDFLFNVKQARANNLALIDIVSGKRFTYQQLQDVVRALGNHLREIGFKPKDVITTHLYNGAEAVIAHLAIQYAGCITCLLDPLIPAQALSYYLTDTQTRCLMTHLKKDTLKDIIPQDVQIINVAEMDKSAWTGENCALDKPYEFGEDALAAIFYTSGTTGWPKGVMLTPRNFYSHFKIFTRACYTYVPEDRLLCFVPFSHGYGSKSIFIPCLYAGATLVIMKSFQPYKVAEIIEKENITHIFGVPSHYQQLLRREELIEPLKKLKAAFSAAALLKLETAQSWKDQVGIFLDEGYGLIETCTGVAFRRSKMPDRLGNIGTYPKDLVDIEIIDEDFSFLPHDERGEIVVRGDSVMIGYLNKPQETARVLHDGWFKTGDMGYKTHDEEIVLTGRIKDVINVAGIKVAPFEIEAALNGHPAVSESAVIGVADETYGEVVKAFVKVQQGAEKDERELVRFLQNKLVNFQIPKEIVFLEAFPRNNMGKIDKKALRAT